MPVYLKCQDDIKLKWNQVMTNAASNLYSCNDASLLSQQVPILKGLFLELSLYLKVVFICVLVLVSLVINVMNKAAYHPLLSDKPLQRGSIRTICSINLRHIIPSQMTRFHSFDTSSAAQRDLASRYESIISAMWSRPFAKKSHKTFYLTPSKCKI